MDRRTFLGTLAGGFLAAPLAAVAQQARKPVKDLTDDTWTNWPWGGWIVAPRILISRHAQRRRQGARDRG